MGLRIDKNHDYRNDKKIAGTSTITASATAPFTAAKITNPILRFASNKNPNPSAAEDSDETSDETPASAHSEASDETSEETTTPPVAATPKSEEDTKSTGTPESSETTGKTIFVYRKWKDLEHERDEINKLSTNEARVVEWHKLNAGVNPKPYVVVDKEKCRLEVYSAEGKVLESIEIGIGKQKGDEIQLKDVEITEKDKKITIKHSTGPNKKSFETTSAGIYSILGKAKVKGGYNEYSITTDRGSTGVAIDELPNGHPAIGNGTLKDNRFSKGDVNLTSEDFAKLGKYVKPGTELYILPEDPNNKIVVKNGQLNLVQDHFTGTVSTSTKSSGLPIKIVLAPPKPPKPENLGFWGTVSKWTWKLPKRAAKGAAEWWYIDEPVKATREKFPKVLAEKKIELMHKLGVDNDTYNELATLALGIGNQETKLGQSPWYHCKENWPLTVSATKWTVSTAKGSVRWVASIPEKVKGWFTSDSTNPSAKKVEKNSKCTSDCNSRGMAQMKFGEYKNKDVNDLLAEHGINSKNVKDPEKSAIATMVVLASMYKNELPALKAHMEKTHMTWQETMLYLWQGKKNSQVLSDKATPKTNNYVNPAERFMNDGFVLKQVVEAPDTVLVKAKQ
jgi:hypothetical protein